jgi:hypothetical protein
VIDIFDAAGLKKPDISILSDEFLAEVQHLPQRNLAVELLQKLPNNELKIRSKKYLVQSRSFAEMLEATIHRYQNRTIEAAQVIAELIELAKQMCEGQKRGNNLGLTDDEGILQLLGNERWCRCRENLVRQSHTLFGRGLFRRRLAVGMPDGFLSSLGFWLRRLPRFLG